MSLLSSDADDCSDITATEGVQGSGDIYNNEGLLDLSIEYLLTKSYPKNSDIKLKRSIRRRASLLISEDGQIFIRRKNRRVKVITTSTDRMKILKACHSDPTSGHFGVTKTRKKISERFYWKGMMQQIKEMVEFCEVCQHMNSKPTVERPQLYPIPVKAPMHHVGIDFVGPISPTTVNGNRFLLTMTDYFTKYGWAKAFPSKEASNVASSLKEIFLILGIPAVITTDQGKEFKNNVNRQFESQLGIEHRLTTAYHPQANGLDERFNQTMKIAIAKLSHEDKASWDINILEIVYAYNTSVQDSTNYTPFQAMYGRIARLPIDINTNTMNPSEQLNSSNFLTINIEQIEKDRTVMNAAIMKNIKKAQDKQSKYYDKKHGAGSSFVVGASVLKKNFFKEKKAWWELGISMGRSIHNFKISGKGAIPIARKKWWKDNSKN